MPLNDLTTRIWATGGRRLSPVCFIIRFPCHLEVYGFKQILASLSLPTRRDKKGQLKIVSDLIPRTHARISMLAHILISFYSNSFFLKMKTDHFLNKKFKETIKIKGGKDDNATKSHRI